MLYFAYGSNMLRERLAARVPSAEPLGGAALPGFRLCFQKRGSDGSAKCDAAVAPEGRLHGVLYRMDPSERILLDRIEALGRGYGLRWARIVHRGRACRAFLYVAQPEFVSPGLRPFRWYRDLVLAGAREHGLPWPCVRALEAVPVREDPDSGRAARHRALLGGDAP